MASPRELELLAAVAGGHVLRGAGVGMWGPNELDGDNVGMELRRMARRHLVAMPLLGPTAADTERSGRYHDRTAARSRPGDERWRSVVR